MVENVISGHTGTLTDGDYILSPSLTNLFEGIHGNGILMYEDTATGDSNRNAKATSPGFVSDNGTNSIVVRGGYAVLDGLIIPFGNIAAGATHTITLQQSTIEGSTSALTSGQTCLLVVYACSDTESPRYGIHIEQGSPVSSGFPVTPEAFLSDTSGLNGSLNLASKQSTALAVVKCTFNASAGDLDMEVTEVYDVRTFVKPSPIYFSPMTTGSLGNQTGRIDSTADLDGMHGGGDEVGGLSSSNFGGMWMSYSYGTDGTDGDHVLYFSGKQGGTRRTHRIGPNKISVLNTAQSVRFDGPNIFNATPASGDINLTPTGTFPPSHMVIVNNAQTSTHKVIFDPSGLSLNSATVGDVNPSSSAIFVYNGSAWVKVFATSSAVGASGSSGAIQISDGSAFSNDSDLTFTGGNTLNTVHLTMAGLLTDASGIALKASVTSNPAGSGPDARTLWYDDGNDVLKFGATAIQLVGGASTIDINGLTAAVLASGDFISFSDEGENGDPTRKESIDDVATLFAGTGLTASSAVIGIDASQPTITAIGPSDAALTVGQNLIVTGNLTVNGTNTVINSTTLQVDDKLIELAHSPSGSEGDDASVDGAGIIIKSSDSDKSILWMDDTNGWEFNQHVFPASDSALNIGSDTIRFATGYLDTLVSTNLTIDTNLLKTDSANNRVGINQAAPDAPFQVSELGFGYGTGSRTGSGLSAVTVNLYQRTKFKAAKLLVSVENTTDSVFETAEMVVTHTGTTTSGTNIVTGDVYLSVYGVVTSSATQQGAYQTGVTGAGDSQYIQLVVTPTVANKDVTVRVSWQALTI
ncbi:hypothetical protein N9246_01145 [bacterium]|nr:hypothetical protein [bacterium]